MKRKSIIWLLALVLAMTLTVPAFAKSYKGKDDWTVTHTKKGDLKTNFSGEKIDEVFADMEPGDTVTISITLKDEYKAKKAKEGDKEKETGETVWYMKNDVIKTFEEAAEVAKDGKYTYKLVYTNPAGENTVLFDSTVGGGKEGLHPATENLDKFFKLDTLKAGDEAKVTLKVGLDGPALDNDFQKTFAKIELDFGVKPLKEDIPEDDTPKTGDSTNALPYFIVMAVSGLAILVLAIFRRRSEKNEA